MIPSLMAACTPRDSVFDAHASDTVYSLDDLGDLDAAAFFAENFVTSGMRQLLTDVFSRMDGSNPDASGAFLLSQAMGGGKTHNLLALGLLAREPALRSCVMGGFAEVRGDLGPVNVLTFSGRQTPDYGIWGELAEKLGKAEVFGRFYAPLRAPGERDWVALLRGSEPILILIDELPPYLNQMLQVPLGQSTLAHATQSALANLLAAINSGKLPNVTLVLTDLSSSAYALADERLSGVLGDMKKEAERIVQTISPVRLDTPELYDILRTRLFAALPSEAVVADIAAAVRQSIKDASQALDIPTDRADELQTAIRRTYPFHPAMQDIFARFRENPGYQQTRALIRIMRQVVASLWSSDLAGERYLIGAHDVDPANPRLASELEKINDRFGNAIAHDIARQTGDAVAQIIDAGQGGHNARDAARLMLMSSLSLATNPTLGLTRADIITFLASPGRDIGNLNSALDALLERAWYLHATADSRILFRTTENVRARLESSVKNIPGDTVRNEIAKSVAALFEPETRDVYQQVDALPDLRDVAITQDRTTLIVARPEAPGSTLLEDFYNALKFKNRVLFVTSREQEYDIVVARKRYHIACEQMVKEFEQS
ncbi:MAG: ATP-binding protein, partial [Thermomicrobiales bacterium]|nr:ATP-binding protein [Thermomicrobiales bacterium]